MTSQYQHGYTYDLFLSYSSNNGAWVKQFHHDLVEVINARAPWPIHTFIDSLRIKPGFRWSEGILAAVTQSAIFVPILSEPFFTSEYCERELDEFKKTHHLILDPFQSIPILPVELTCEAPEDHFLRTLQSTRFFHEDERGIRNEFRRETDRDAYDSNIRFLAESVKSIIERIPTLYLPSELLAKKLSVQEFLYGKFEVPVGTELWVPIMEPTGRLSPGAHKLAQSARSNISGNEDVLLFRPAFTVDAALCSSTSGSMELSIHVDNPSLFKIIADGGGNLSRKDVGELINLSLSTHKDSWSLTNTKRLPEVLTKALSRRGLTIKGMRPINAELDLPDKLCPVDTLLRKFRTALGGRTGQVTIEAIGAGTRQVRARDLATGYSNRLYEVKPESRIQFRASSAESSYLYLFNLDPGGGVALIYPNGRNPDNWLKAYSTAQIPGDGVEFVVESKKGKEYFLAVCTEKKADDLYQRQLTEGKDGYVDRFWSWEDAQETFGQFVYDLQARKHGWWAAAETELSVASSLSGDAP